MRTLVVGIVLLATATSLSAQSRKPDHFLDIPGQSISHASPAAPYFPEHRAIVSLSHQTFVKTLKVTLVSTDLSDFTYGDYFVYEVLIENTGKQSVTIPWSPDMGAFAQPVKRTPPGFLRGALSLHVESVDGKSELLALLDSQSLYGSDEIPRSLLVLAPGRTALVRVPAQWSATMDVGRAAVLRQPEGAVRLRAVVSIATDDLPALTRSDNSIPVRVIPRQLR